MIQYLMKMKYNGKPNPMNYNYLELFSSGTEVFIIGRKQHGQNTFLEFGLRKSSTSPGLLALAWFWANFQSGGIMSRSII